jgi:biopolymer transport protein TolQ
MEGSPSFWSLIFGADIIVQLVVLLLVFMSVVCWGIILLKWIRLWSAVRQSSSFLDLFWRSKRLDTVYDTCGKYRRSPVAEVFKAGYQELAKVTQGGNTEDASDNLMRTLRRSRMSESTKLEKYVTFLATTGSTAPFIGLFGTVWGILLAFSKLSGATNATIQVVGPDISHALIATAIGLVAAIPAVMAYNYFNAKIRVLNTEMENFSADFMNIVKRHLK